MNHVTRENTVLTSSAKRPVLRPALVALAAGAALALGLSVIAPAAGSSEVVAEGRRGQRCTDDTIRGSYGFVVTGTRPAGPGVTEQIIGTGIITYDGRGGFLIVDDVHGEISGAARERVMIGTYEVRPNCTGTATIFVPDAPFDIHSSFVVVDGGQEVRQAVMSPQPAMVTSLARRM